MTMKLDTRTRLLGTTVLPIMLGVGLAAAGCTETASGGGDAAYAAACKACGACNPCACNPCAAKACNPCAAAACNPCNPCNPCGGAGALTECVVPRLAANPCAAKACNPCNPCAAAACSPCNPCAAKACNPCNPCNPCAAAACNPCNPCAAGGGIELTDAEAAAAYDCARPAMAAAYARSGLAAARDYPAWRRYSTGPYASATHGGRYVDNYANPAGAAYGRYEQGGPMAAGTVLAKDSFTVGADGRVAVGPLFLMAKMDAGFNADTLDWRYQIVMPDGSLFGTTNGAGAAKVQFCADCHNAMADHDALWFLPEAYRR